MKQGNEDHIETCEDSQYDENGEVMKQPTRLENGTVSHI